MSPSLSVSVNEIYEYIITITLLFLVEVLIGIREGIEGQHLWLQFYF
jgi:hypothetical protein